MSNGCWTDSMLELAAALCAGAAVSVAAVTVAVPVPLIEMPARSHLRTAMSSLVAHEAELASSSGWSWLELSRLLLIELAAAALAASAAWMFPGLPVLGIPSAVGAVTLVRFVAGARSRTRRRERQDSVLEAVRMLRQVLEAGAGGLQQAITALAERGPLPLRSEFRLIAATSVGRRQAWRAALAGGGLCTGSVLFAMRVVRIEPATWLPVSAWWQRLQNFERLRDHLALQIERAGWRESPERVAVLSAVLSVGLCALGLSASIFVQEVNAAVFALAGATAGAGAVGLALRSAINSRRRRMSRELAPLLELFLLELGGGGSPLSALGSVSMQVDGELAVELRRLLITSQVAGSVTFEPRLREYAERIDLPALSSLATILTASREYGTAVSQGVRALAADLRRAQRRELIAHSRP